MQDQEPKAPMQDQERKEYRVELALSPGEVTARLARLAEAWNGEWQDETTPESSAPSGRLGLPVAAGLRRGWVAGQVTLEPRGEGESLLVYRVDRGEMHLDRAAVGVLVVGALGGLVSMVAPFFPSLLVLVPVGLVLGFTAWLMVVARLRNAGPIELFDLLEEG